MITIAPKIADLQISANEDELLLIMSLLYGNYQKRILCKGVNNISINSISYPMQIGGIEFIDHKKRDGMNNSDMSLLTQKIKVCIFLSRIFYYLKLAMLKLTKW